MPNANYPFDLMVLFDGACVGIQENRPAPLLTSVSLRVEAAADYSQSALFAPRQSSGRFLFFAPQQAKRGEKGFHPQGLGRPEVNSYTQFELGLADGNPFLAARGNR